MKIRNLLILGLVLVGFTYCSSDEVLDGPTGNETANNLKMEIAIKMPTGATTRSTTGATDTEPGKELGTLNENKVNSVTIALYSGTAQTWVATHTSNLGGDGVNAGTTYYTTAEFELPTGALGKTYYVYAFVNPYTDINVESLQAAFTAKGTLAATIDAITKVGGVTDGGQSNFFMSNAEKVETITVNESHIKGAPLKVGVSVQRAVARMDYKTNALITDEKYKVGSSDVDVIFTGYKLINSSRSFYNLKRVNDGSSVPAATDFTGIGKPELVGDYVVDTDWDAKVLPIANPNVWNGGFFNYMGTTVNDNYKALGESSYVTENTIPAINKSKKGLATAVVFKGQLVVPTTAYTAPVATHPYTVVNGESPVYVWNNTFYGTFDKLPQAIQDIVPLNASSTKKDSDITDKASDLAKAGVTGYSYDSTYGGYPVYYVYYNRHNDNGDKAATGAMEFAVVRNNIYKLTINSLSKFGHPNDPEGTNTPNPDPNPEKPEDDIESSTLYMQVTATILDWTVRLNEIEF